MTKTKSASCEIVGRTRIHSKSETGALFDKGNGAFVPMERPPKIGGARGTQAARPTMAEFAASISHQIRQPLTSVVLNAEASLRWLAQMIPTWTRHDMPSRPSQEKECERER